jgi:AmmeMemoRadiSam system protein A
MPSESITDLVADHLTPEEQTLLLELARSSIEQTLEGKGLIPLVLDDFPIALRQQGSSFVTLKVEERLRGCVGALEAFLPLAEDVRKHAIGAALFDYRFPPLRLYELPEMRIEISRLKPTRPLHYTCPEDLLISLRPGIDGVVLMDEQRRATFLPKVWLTIPEPDIFLSLLCQKMGAPPDTWRKKMLTILTYEVEDFQE